MYVCIYVDKRNRKSTKKTVYHSAHHSEIFQLRLRNFNRLIGDNHNTRV